MFKRVSLIVVLVFVGLAAIWGVFSLSYYGAVTPCGIVQKDLEKRAASMIEEGSLGTALGVQLGMTVASRRIQESSEWECFQMLPKLKSAPPPEQEDVREYLGNHEYRSVDWEVQLCRRALVAYADQGLEPPSYIQITCQDVLERQVTGAKWKNEARRCAGSAGKDLVLCLEPVFR